MHKKCNPNKETQLYVNRSSSQVRSRGKLVLEGTYIIKVCYTLKFKFEASNNKVEYEASIAGLMLVKEISAKYLQVFFYSMPVIQQIKGKYNTKVQGMIKYLQLVQTLIAEFTSWNITEIPRVENFEVDQHSKFALITIPEPYAA